MNANRKITIVIAETKNMEFKFKNVYANLFVWACIQ